MFTDFHLLIRDGIRRRSLIPLILYFFRKLVFLINVRSYLSVTVCYQFCSEQTVTDHYRGRRPSYVRTSHTPEASLKGPRFEGGVGECTHRTRLPNQIPQLEAPTRYRQEASYLTDGAPRRRQNSLRD